MNPELDELAAEAAGGTTGEAAAPAGEVASPADQLASWRVMIDQSLRPVCAALTGAFGVDPVNDQERQAIAAAAAEVAVLYDWANLDPRVVAWLTLGGSVLAVVMPRLQQVRARRVVSEGGQVDATGQDTAGNDGATVAA